MYAAAVRVLNEEGGRLSPLQVLGVEFVSKGRMAPWVELETSSAAPLLQVLGALPDSMPLGEAVATLEPTLVGVMHRRRQTQVGLHSGDSSDAMTREPAMCTYNCLLANT